MFFLSSFHVFLVVFFILSYFYSDLFLYFCCSFLLSFILLCLALYYFYSITLYYTIVFHFFSILVSSAVNPKSDVLFVRLDSISTSIQPMLSVLSISYEYYNVKTINTAKNRI